MANYNTQYSTSFDDTYLNTWRIDLALKDGPMVANPVSINYTGEPVILERKNDTESKFQYIIQTQCTLNYLYTGDVDQPHPELFINIDNDTWMVSIYKGNTLEWRGFINPDTNTYSWIPAPFPFKIIASDFSFMEGTTIYLDNDISFLYDFVTIGDFINRTLFHSIGYSDPVLNIMYSPKPDIIGSSNITNALYIHTDAFYDFDKGPMFVKDALNRFLSSIGARMSQSRGVYWLQMIDNIGDVLAQIIQITPTDLTGVIIPNASPFITMGNTVGDAVVYSSLSQELMVLKSLKQKTFHYNLKAINQLSNFDWRDFTPPNILAGWDVSPTENIDRVGMGSIDNPYRLRIFDRSPGEIIPFVSQNITAISGQRLQVQLKFVGNFAKDIGIGVQIGPSGSDQIVLSTSGEWVPRLSPGTDNTAFPITIPNTNIATVDILSAPIPPGADTSQIRFLIFYPRVVDSGLPVGETLYVDVYPAFVRRFNDLYIKIDETVKNDAKFSYVADDEDLFFLDKADENLSNTLFYDDSGTKRALPLNNWDGKTIDEIATMQQAIQQSDRTYAALGTFLTNSFTFEQGVLLRDKGFLATLPIRQSYSIKSGTSNMMTSQQQRTSLSNITRTIFPITKEQQS